MLQLKGHCEICGRLKVFETLRDHPIQSFKPLFSLRPRLRITEDISFMAQRHPIVRLLLSLEALAQPVHPRVNSDILKFARSLLMVARIDSILRGAIAG
ncbi:hypothetical protein XH97_34335 [Bradyrhizobium sp. CCBAU 53380]|nr:hypothetical protein [Bradyrhizobium sp. CCBAU 53380]